MKKAKKYALDHNRRKFLRKSAATGAGVAIAAALPGLAAAGAEEMAGEAPKHDKGYRLTPHIAAYYKTMTS